MVLDRRTLLRTAGATALAGLAGCTSSLLDGDADAREYSLHVTHLSGSPVEHALYEPVDDALFGDPARAALDGVLPDGRHTTYGYAPLPDDAYVTHDSRYYQIRNVVTGRKAPERTLVRAEPLPDDAETPADAVHVDDLPRPSARIAKILHSYAQTSGEGGSSDVLRDGAYVLRRPAEIDGNVADLDGQVVTMKPGGPWVYRLRTATERIVETAHTAVAIEVADSREAFREVVFASRIDAELAPADLSTDVRDLLDRAVGLERYDETTPLSAEFESLLDVLGIGDVETMVNSRLLWYDERFYRYALYVNDAD